MTFHRNQERTFIPYAEIASAHEELARCRKATPTLIGESIRRL